MVTPQALNASTFGDFGDVIEVQEGAPSISINQGFTERYHDLATVDVEQQNGRTLISVFRSTPLPSPIKIAMMERHPLSSQAFMPLSNKPYLVVVAKAGEFNEAAIQVFLAQANQGVNYHAGTWHHFCLALGDTSDFLVIDRGGEGHNCDEVLLNKPFSIQLS
ncbi:MAG: ureidoglycolate lyase [Cryomorphaceae bacterium]|jgi:ureidoglycolate lyase